MLEDPATQGVNLLALISSARLDSTPQKSVARARLRDRHETTVAHRVKRSQITQVRARNLWHFGNRLVRKMLSHTITVRLNADLGLPPIQRACVLDQQTCTSR